MISAGGADFGSATGLAEACRRTTLHHCAKVPRPDSGRISARDLPAGYLLTFYRIVRGTADVGHVFFGVTNQRNFDFCSGYRARKPRPADSRHALVEHLSVVFFSLQSRYSVFGVGRYSSRQPSRKNSVSHHQGRSRTQRERVASPQCIFGVETTSEEGMTELLNQMMGLRGIGGHPASCRGRRRPR